MNFNRMFERIDVAMPLFESTLVLLAVAVVLLTVARRLRISYPAMLALAGGLVATLPWAPRIGIEPHLALALFVAPAVMDTAFDMPPRELLRMWLPLTSLAVILVLLTALAVAATGVLMAGLPLAAAIALGAIVAPPEHDRFRRIAITAQRRVLVEWRRRGQLDDDAYHLLEAELDRAELQTEAPIAG